MRASIILALASLMSNMTEALTVTAAGSDIGPVKLFESDDCTGDAEEVKKGPFCTANRRRCKKANSVKVPEGKTLVVRYKDLIEDAIETLDIVGDGTCVNVEDFVLSNGGSDNEGFDDEADFKINGGNIIFNE